MEKPEKTPDIKMKRTKGWHVVTKKGRRWFKTAKEAKKYMETHETGEGSYIEQGDLVTLYTEKRGNKNTQAAKHRGCIESRETK